MTTPAVVAEGLRKRYGDVHALDGFDLSVQAGSVCGLLGPNGAGKTTAVRILATLLRGDAGRAEVAGFDVARRAADVRRRIGLVGQHAAIDDILGGRQNLVMFGRLYHLGARAAGRRADVLLAQFGLADAGAKPVKQYSGGMRRRLDLAASLILSPSVLFLDEPTIGLDPRGRNEVWETVRTHARAGTTVLLTTQYLDEADQLADRIAVIDHGRVIAEGTPDRLKAQIGGDRIEVVARTAEEVAVAASVVGRVAAADAEVDLDRRRVSAPLREPGSRLATAAAASALDAGAVSGPLAAREGVRSATGEPDRVAALTALVRQLDDAGIAAEDIALRRPTLDEVFLDLTGRPA